MIEFIITLQINIKIKFKSEIVIFAVCFQLKQLKKHPEKNSGLIVQYLPFFVGYYSGGEEGFDDGVQQRLIFN